MAILTREHTQKTYRDIGKECRISKSSAHRYYKDKTRILQRKKSPTMHRSGRKSKFTSRDIRSLERALKTLRKQSVNFSAMDVVREAGFRGDEASERTFRRYLNQLGYKFMVCRKKGLLNENDRVKILRYAREMNTILKQQPNYYKDHVAFYLDGVSFVHKYNPYRESLSPRGRVWRKPGEGLSITAKGSKDLPAGRRVHCLVAIAYGKGVILVEEYERMNGQYFSTFISEHLNLAFGKAGPKYNSLRMFCMDNDPSQNSQQALAEIAKKEASMHAIPARSPDLNPIENIFHTAKSILQEQAINNQIKTESLSDFTRRVTSTLWNLNAQDIDKVIDTMPKRVQNIIVSKGNRTKY